MDRKVITITRAMRQEKSLTLGEICCLHRDNRKQDQDAEQQATNEAYLDLLLIERICTNDVQVEILKQWLEAPKATQKQKVLTKRNARTLQNTHFKTI